VKWTPSRFDGRRQGGMPEVRSSKDDSSRCASAGQSKEWLYLFTTVELPREQVLALYGKRWNIETDLRSLKRTVRLHHISARNESMMEKELLTAIGAYNLVRAVMALAARRHNLSPRQLSFTFVLTWSTPWHRLQSAPDAEPINVKVRLLDAAAEGFTPNEKSADRFRSRLASSSYVSSSQGIPMSYLSGIGRKRLPHNWREPPPT